ncbi:hypothetical protein SK128_002911 [Halocaridina rubra]|uniref:Glycoside hydrolase family 2 catalytic domain-containing protein n=1 Tax=Halocaridina rubra TaxID=373956 RepID=A0AAN8ZVK7_HALRR
MKWLGVNCFRTSHYPYAEEIMNMADEEGMMVIDESAAVNLINFDDQLLSTHITVMEELVRRDKNRPSVIMWSVANEPRSAQAPADKYFSAVVNATRAFDPTRPITAALNVNKYDDHAGKSMDVIMVNRYYSWYNDPGHLELIENQTVAEYIEWRDLYDKPMMISEYGAGAVIGLHKDPASMWSEEYQVNLMLNNFKAFDTLRSYGYFAGEMIWNFADFETDTSISRVAGNRKGMFTRNRQPKLSAHILRQRYHELAGVPIGDLQSAFAKKLMS